MNSNDNEEYKISSYDPQMNLMQSIAKDNIEFNEIDSEKLVDSSKLFLIAQAKKEANRVVKLTDFLDKMESRFISAVENKLEENPDNINLITGTIDVISNALTRSNSIITQIVKDDKLSSVVINTTNIISENGSNATIINADSRDTIRNYATTLLSELQKDVIVEESD